MRASGLGEALKKAKRESPVGESIRCYRQCDYFGLALSAKLGCR
jgi:hypothetical protein